MDKERNTTYPYFNVITYCIMPPVCLGFKQNPAMQLNKNQQSNQTTYCKVTHLVHGQHNGNADDMIQLQVRKGHVPRLLRSRP
jgi:hypothetical protein